MNEFEVDTSRTPSGPIKLNRVNVFLGANGTGKSKLLNEIRSTIPSILSDFEILNIEGGRALQMYDTLELDRQNFNNYKTYKQTYSGYQSKRQGTLQSRLFDGLKILEQLSESQKMEHSDAVTEWARSETAKAEPNSMPRRAADPISRVFETFSDIFPSISLKYHPSERRLRCTKNGSRYGPTSLSDGEKQVFSVLVDVAELVDKKTILFVDEPELNLHPSLANRLWSSVESLLPDSIFIYATHSVSFAMRESVDHILVISDENENIHRLENLDDLPLREREELLGNISSLIANKKTLLVEGNEDSFDSIFYNWIIDDKKITPAAVGGCEDVAAIVKRTGKWSHISSKITLSGIIDRDYKSDKHLSSLQSAGVMALPYHEAESLLCLPRLLVELGQAIGSVADVPTEQELVQSICSFVQDNELKIVARRVAAHLNVKVGISVPGKTLARIESEEQLKALLIADARHQKDHIEKSFDDKLVENLIAAELKTLRVALEDKNVDSLLVFAPGKELLSTLAPKIGCLDANAASRAARHHLSVSNFPHLLKLRKQLVTAFVELDPPSAEVELVLEAE